MTALVIAMSDPPLLVAAFGAFPFFTILAFGVVSVRRRKVPPKT